MDERTRQLLDRFTASASAVRALPDPGGGGGSTGFADTAGVDPLDALRGAARAIVDYLISAARRAQASDATLQFAFPLSELWGSGRLDEAATLSRSIITVQAFARTVDTQQLHGDPRHVRSLAALTAALRTAVSGEARLGAAPPDPLQAPWDAHLREGDRWGDVLGYQAPTAAARARSVWRAIDVLLAAIDAEPLVLPPAAPEVPQTPLLPTPTTALRVYDDLDLGSAFQVRLEPAPAVHDGDVIDVWFGTSRALRPGTVGEFGPERSPRLMLGRCDVYVPAAHRRGSQGSGIWQKIIRWDFRDDTLKLHRTTVLGDAFDRELRARLDEIGSTRALLYIHGYNSPFEAVAITAAQLAVDLDIPGVPVVFSWPSHASILDYVPDLTQAESAWEQLVEFLARLRGAGVEQLDIIVHSMGNRVLSWAMERLATAGTVIDRLYLAAADLDPDILRQRSSFYRAVCTAITSYASTSDRALGLSRIVHKADRVGLVPPVTTAEEMTTIDVSAVDDSFLGHGYFAMSSPVLDDIGADMRGVAPGAARRLRRSRTGADLPYWTMRAE